MTALRPEQKKQLADAALAVRKQAYANYSKFHVGAALLTADGRIFSGANVENASYGLTICAERSAVFTAVSAGAREFVAMAVATPGGAAPCGACRQVLAEFAPHLPILLVAADQPQNVRETTLDVLLPSRFEWPEG